MSFLLFQCFYYKKTFFCSLCRINHDTYKFAISSCDVTLRRCFRFWVFPCNHIYLTQLLCTAIITCCKSHDKAALKYSLILYLEITHPKSNMFLCFFCNCDVWTGLYCPLSKLIPLYIKSGVDSSSCRLTLVYAFSSSLFLQCLLT